MSSPADAGSVTCGTCHEVPYTLTALLVAPLSKHVTLWACFSCIVLYAPEQKHPLLQDT